MRSQTDPAKSAEPFFNLGLNVICENLVDGFYVTNLFRKILKTTLAQ